MAGPTLGVAKPGPSYFPRSGQYFYSRKPVQPTIQDNAAVKFRRSGSSSAGASFGVLLPNRATNAWAVGALTDDASALSILGGVVRTMGSATDALSYRMVGTS
jgi:hypothetical protein